MSYRLDFESAAKAGDRRATRSGGDRRKEESRDEVAQRRDGIRGVDGRPQVRSVLDALRVPRPERADLVDDPALVAGLCHQKVDVVEEGLPAVGHRDLDG